MSSLSSGESHPRQWVDTSGPAYSERNQFLLRFLPFQLPTHLRVGESEEKKQGKKNSESAASRCRLNRNNPPTTVWGIPALSLQPGLAEIARIITSTRLEEQTPPRSMAFAIEAV
jgi:hypothetical protein